MTDIAIKIVKTAIDLAIIITMFTLCSSIMTTTDELNDAKAELTERREELKQVSLKRIQVQEELSIVNNELTSVESSIKSLR